MSVVVNPRRAFTARVTVVVVSVCVSFKSHLTSGASVCPENAATYSACNEGQKFVAFSLKLRRSRATALPAFYGYRAVGHFLSAEYARALLKCHVDRGAGFGQ